MTGSYGESEGRGGGAEADRSTTGDAPGTGGLVIRGGAVRAAGGRGPIVLSEVTCTLAPGIVAVLGPNGAGKSTLMRALAGVFPWERGTVTWQGRDLGNAATRRRLVAYVPQFPGLFPGLSVQAFLVRMAVWLEGPGWGNGRDGVGGAATERVTAAIRHWDLSHEAARRIGDLTADARRRLTLAAAWLRGAPIALLDEPTAQLAVEERDAFWLRLRRWVQEPEGPALVWVTTHRLGEAEAFCDQALVLGAGRSWFAGPARTLRALAEGRTFTVPQDAPLPASGGRNGPMRYRVTGVEGDRLRVLAYDPQAWPDMPGTQACPPRLVDGYLVLGAGTFQARDGDAPRNRRPFGPRVGEVGT